MGESNNEWLYRIGLTMINGVGPVLAKNLLAYCGSAEKVFTTPKSKLEKVPGIGAERAAKIAGAEALLLAEQELKFVEKHQIQPLFFAATNYPTRLLDCTDAPLLLYYKGNANLNADKVVAIVGTRRATEYGKEQTKRMIAELAAQNVLVLSGLAFGIDTVAHSASVDANLPTVGVLGHGLNTIYPNQNRALAKRMLENGGLLTEYTSTDIMRPENFADRNRVVAGMSDCVVVIESATDGGALITANIAHSYNRDVFALPGRVNDKFSKGCHSLIRTNRAALVESGTDVIEAMNWQTNLETKTHKHQQQKLALQLSDEEKLVHNVLSKNDETHIDVLADEAKINSSVLAAILLEMEMNGLINSLPGKRFKLA
ncbi:MAG: DNA-protecting protein DprA [Chitinophagales bacterium]|nr:DNA-protecting protein DprA [Chitinophagales bacterium]